MADVIDWHRQQIAMTHTSASLAAEPPKFKPTQRQHLLEDEEDVLAALENQAISTEEAERQLAAIQAFNTEIEVDNPAGGMRWQ